MEGGTAEIGLMESRVATDWAHRIPHRRRSCCSAEGRVSQAEMESYSAEQNISPRLREYIPHILLAMGGGHIFLWDVLAGR